ncbi:MAG: response regulator [Nitrospirae bacterium]|nr:response regulator [Nitrospirota bacterium]
MSIERANEDKKILVVDEGAISKTLSIILKHEGYSVTTAKNGKEAIKIIDRNSFNLIIIGIEMTRIEELTLIKKIKNIPPHMPVVIMSAMGTKDTIKRAINAGASDYLIKPFDYVEFKNAVVKNVIGKG